MEEPSGIPVEAVEERPKRRGSTAPKAVDWQKVQEDYVDKLLPAKQVAEKYGLKVNHVYQRAHRFNWPTPANQATAIANRAIKTAINKRVSNACKAVEPVIDQAVKDWQERTLRHAGTAVDRVGEKLAEPLEVEDLKTAVSALDVADRVGRRALGLDREASGSGDTGTFRFALGVRLELLTSPAAPDPVGPVIDVSSSEQV